MSMPLVVAIALLAALIAFVAWGASELAERARKKEEADNLLAWRQRKARDAARGYHGDRPGEP